MHKWLRVTHKPTKYLSLKELKKLANLILIPRRYEIIIKKIGLPLMEELK